MVEHVQIINVTHCLNKMKEKNYVAILIDTKKAFDKSFFMIKTLKKLDIKVRYLNIIITYMTNLKVISFSVVKS
jgi:hypothetical protein